jgi:probable biosynthetic protein (TIGR04098 family)
MRTARPEMRLARRWNVTQAESHLARLARAARRGEPLDDAFAGPSLDPETTALDRVAHEPSPYADYNAAGLLYFAAYPTIADTAERKLVRRLKLGRELGRDWALATSSVARDVFYYGNLPLGDGLLVELVSFVPERAGVKTRVRLRRARDAQVIADVITRRAFVHTGERR